MDQPNNSQKTLFRILGTLSLTAGIIGVVIVLKIVLESDDSFGVLSDRLVGVASVPALIGAGVFILRKASKVSKQKPRTL